MKKDSKLNVPLTIFRIYFALSPLFSININFTARGSNRGPDYGEDNSLDNEILKISRAPGKIHLNHSWPTVKAAKICTDSVTYSDLNSIEDLVLDRGGAFL